MVFLVSQNLFQFRHKIFVFYYFVGGLLCSLIMSKIFKIHDGIIGTFAGFWDTLAVIAYFLANQNWQLYISKIHIFGVFRFSINRHRFSLFFIYVFIKIHLYYFPVPLIDIFHGVALSTFFSFASKFFDSHEFGKITNYVIEKEFELTKCFFSVSVFSFMFL